MQRVVLVHGSVHRRRPDLGRAAAARRAVGARRARPARVPSRPAGRARRLRGARRARRRAAPARRSPRRTLVRRRDRTPRRGAAPERVRSLTVIEPPATERRRRASCGRPFGREGADWWRDGPRDDPEAFLRGFLGYVGSAYDPPSPLPPQVEQGARTLIRERGPWEAEIPLDELAAAPFPKLVVSGRPPRSLRHDLQRARGPPGRRAGGAPGRRPQPASDARLQRGAGGLPPARLAVVDSCERLLPPTRGACGAGPVQLQTEGGRNGTAAAATCSASDEGEGAAKAGGQAHPQRRPVRGHRGGLGLRKRGGREPRRGGAADSGLEGSRAAWWSIGDQGATGSCVGWATADSVVRWHLVKANRISQTDSLSPRFIWMAAKETDQFDARPTTFVETEGTSLKSALDITRKYGVLHDRLLPFASVDQHVDLEEAAVALRPSRSPSRRTRSPARRRRSSSSTSGNISLPHQPPRYGVSSGWPVSSVMNGPTIVPLRVSTASTATGRLLIRFITLTSWPTMSLAVLLPAGLVVDEEGGLAGVAVRRLDHQVGAKPGRRSTADQVLVVLDGGEDVGHAGRADVVAEPGRDELRVQVLAQLRRRAGSGRSRVRRRSARSRRRRTPSRSSAADPADRRLAMKASTSGLESSQLLISSPDSNSM